MHIRSIMSCVLFLIIISSAACGAEGTIDVDDVLEDLLYADLVVEGEVCSISEITVPSRDFFMDVPDELDETFAVFAFKVKRVLIGDWEEEFVPVVGFTGFGSEYHFDLEEGDTYVLALRLHHGGKGIFESTRYILRRDAGRFLVLERISCFLFLGIFALIPAQAFTQCSYTELLSGNKWALNATLGYAYLSKNEPISADFSVGCAASTWNGVDKRAIK